ncbi:MAG: hypothetical protein JOY80_06815 [Candidatus Dormibacteraeota bacterium]|nr:hypothetical protein [Candidatus Dormibacteraeota bacterium]
MAALLGVMAVTALAGHQLSGASLGRAQQGQVTAEPPQSSGGSSSHSAPTSTRHYIWMIINNKYRMEAL